MMSEGERKVYLALYLNKEGLHIREICRQARFTLPAVLKHVNSGVSQKTILCESKGRLKLCRLNFRSQRLVPILQEVELERFSKLPHEIQDSSNSFIADLKEKPLMAFIFGSYAKGSYHKGSDLDVLLVFQRMDNRLAKDIENSTSRIGGRTGVNVQPVSISYGEFEKNLLDRENEFMKDIRKGSLALSGLDLYLGLLGRFYG
jgi:predicted nucleotidyltransferase